MKIRTITISNILTFPERDLKGAPTMAFDTPGIEGSIHILIGPNGSGKSNFMEVLNQVFKRTLSRPASFNTGAYQQVRQGNFQNAQQVLNLTFEPTQHLAAHYGSEDKPRRMTVEISLNAFDHKNLTWISANAQEINKVLKVYSDRQQFVPEGVKESELTSISSLTIDFSIQPDQQLALQSSAQTQAQHLALFYLERRELLQRLIEFHNEENPKQTWPTLLQTFALLAGSREAIAADGGAQANSSRDQTFAQLTKQTRDESVRAPQSNAPAVFQLLHTRLAFMLADIAINEERAPTAALEALRNSPLLTSINELLKKYLGLEFRVERASRYEQNVICYLQNLKRKKKQQAQDLSSGERSIANLIFSLFGYELQSGMVLIDEPELHLHPQWQHAYLEVLEEIRKKRDLQVILATHSPAFVSADTIKHVFRFRKSTSGATQVITASMLDIDPILVRTLDYTNAAKVFFSSKVLLVEGETDEYFLKHFIGQLRVASKGDLRDRLNDLEIVSIKGKGNFQSFKKLLGDFGLQVSFFGDWDSISLVSRVDVQSYKEAYHQAIKTAGAELIKKGSGDGAELIEVATRLTKELTKENAERVEQVVKRITARHVPYAMLIRFLREQKADEWARIEKDIDTARKDHLYILKNGELEDYLGIPQKGLDGMIRFCGETFATWFEQESSKDHREEIRQIIETIALS